MLARPRGVICAAISAAGKPHHPNHGHPEQGRMWPQGCVLSDIYAGFCGKLVHGSFHTQTEIHGIRFAGKIRREIT